MNTRPTDLSLVSDANPPLKQQRFVSAEAYTHYLKARISMAKNDPISAIQQMKQAIAYDPHSAHLLTSLGQLYATRKHWKKSMALAKQATKIDPNNIRSLMLLGMGRVHTGNPNAALASFQQVIDLSPKYAEAYFKIARIHAQQKEKAKALASLEKLTQVNPTSADGFRKFADLAFEYGQEKKAENAYLRALVIDPFNIQTIRTLAGLLEQQGRYAEAIEVFNEALITLPGNPYFMAFMARLYLKNKEEKAAQAYIDQLRAFDSSYAGLIANTYAEINLHAEALAELERFIKNKPDHFYERMLAAYLNTERKQWNQALMHLQAIPSKSRYYLSARITSATTLMQLNRYQEALSILDSSLAAARAPGDISRIHRNLAILYAKLKKFSVGLQIMDSAIQKWPDLSDIYEAKADLLFAAGRGLEGLDLLQSRLRLDPENESLLFAIGSLYERMGAIPESIAAMRSILELDPNNSSALNFIGYTLVDQDKDLEEAEPLIRRALLLNPGNGAITDSLGWLLYKQGRYQEALKYLLRADRATPNEAIITMHIGDAYLKLDKMDLAIEHYRRAMAFAPDKRDLEEILKRFKTLGINPSSTHDEK
jgi:tetratricopeptide (TPR) repeat protein